MLPIVGQRTDRAHMMTKVGISKDTMITPSDAKSFLVPVKISDRGVASQSSEPIIQIPNIAIG